MKKTIILASVAIATLFAFSSCQKENLENNNSLNGVRIITAEFENSTTKTTLNTDGKTPLWSENDVIRILSSGAYKDVTLEAGSGTPAEGKGIINANGSIIIAIPDTMTGTLYAVYPASATTMTSCSGNIDFTIPSTQYGTFASANICVANGDDEDNLVFRNATAVLKIKTAADVVGVEINATNNIAGPVTASFSGSDISLTSNNLTGKSVFVLSNSAPSGNVFYLAAAPVATGNTTATCYKSDKKGSTDKDSKELAKNTIYSMDLSSMSIDTYNDLTGQHGTLNGHEYVIIKAKYDGTNESYLKWATRNIGATADTGVNSYGTYFAWGDTDGYALTSSTKSTINNPSFVPGTNISNAFENTHEFSWTTAPFNNGVPDECDDQYFANNKSTWIGTDNNLKSEYDAATKNWGTGWRMPKGYVGTGIGEFIALKDATYWNWEDNGYYVYAPQSGDAGGLNGKKSDENTDVSGTYTKTDALLFFPAAGGGMDGPNFGAAGNYGFYWSHTLYLSTFADYAYFLNFDKSGVVKPQDYGDRCSGYSVRPVSD